MTTQKNFNVFLFILLLGVFSPLMAQNMSDSQVLEYVKEGIRQGKEQKQLASELARKGVTKEQAMRVKQLYEQQNNVNASNATGTDVNESRLREEMKESTSDMLEAHPSTQDIARSNQVFGRNIFNTRNLTFEPSVNIATPLNYRLGPGDEVIIDIWGASQNTIRQQISPDGTINIQKIGPVNLNGLTIAEANDYLKKTLNKIYNGLNNTNDPTSDIRLTLGSIRTHPDFFKSNGYIGRGISGQTSYQFLLRFREDVINLSPALVVINAGTNDVAENTQAYNEDYTFGNIVSMAELAKANKIKVILTSVLPAAAFKWRMEIKDVPQKIKSLNDRIEAYAKANKIPFVNYYKAMVVDENQALNPQYTKDGVHPTSEGYDIMEPLIKNAIEKAL